MSVHENIWEVGKVNYNICNNIYIPSKKGNSLCQIMLNLLCVLASHKRNMNKCVCKLCVFRKNLNIVKEISSLLLGSCYNMSTSIDV